MKQIREFACIVIRFWQDVLDSLNTDGGHILLFLILIHWADKVPALKEHMELVIGGLLLILKTAVSNKTRRDRPVPTIEETDVHMDTHAEAAPVVTGGVKP